MVKDMPPWIEIALTIVGGLFVWSCTLIGATLWITREFTATRKVFFEVIDATAKEIESQLRLEKTELVTSFKELDVKFNAHDRLDSERFKAMELAIMRIELREQNRGDIVSPHQITRAPKT